MSQLYMNSLNKLRVNRGGASNLVLTFTFDRAIPESVTINTPTRYMFDESKALWDNGDGQGWRDYQDQVIPCSSNTLSFKGNWLNKGNSFSNLFQNTFNQGYLVSVSGVFPMMDGKSISPDSYGLFASTFEGCTDLFEVAEGIFGETAKSLKGDLPISMFVSTFKDCANLGNLPSGLFSTISGKPSEEMFTSTFEGCTGLTMLPSGLFKTIIGPPEQATFLATFKGCTYLNFIEDGLFDSISGDVRTNTFLETFNGCSSLMEIPVGLFKNITGAPAFYSFNGTFENCSSLSSIPIDLFIGLSGTPEEGCFVNTFKGCENLESESEKNSSGEYLYQRFVASGINFSTGCYNGCVKLQDYVTIPSTWK